MCGNPFKSSSPSVQKVAPAPQAVTTPEVNTANDDANDKARRRRGYAATRVAEDRAVLTDTTNGRRTTLG